MNLPPSIVFWGTYDISQPRARLLYGAAVESGCQTRRCHFNVWGELENKLHGGRLRLTARVILTLAAYPLLIWRYLRLPKHDLVLILSPGWLDLLVIAPFARLFRSRIVWDCYLPLYEALVEDRRVFAEGSLAARAIAGFERLCSRIPDKILLDTEDHAKYFRDQYQLPPGRTASVPVGVETSIFSSESTANCSPPSEPPQILFYGRLLPLHGISVIIDACARVAEDGVKFRLLMVGTGQLEDMLRGLLDRTDGLNVVRIKEVPYHELPQLIRNSRIGLGIFGVSPKTQRVVPNKVFQMAAVGIPIITADTPAIRELFQPDEHLRLISAGRPTELAEAIKELLARPPLARRSPQIFGPEQLSRWFKNISPELFSD